MSHPNQGSPDRNVPRSRQPTQIAHVGWPQQAPPPQGAPPYGAPPQGASPYGAPAYGQPPYGAPPYGAAPPQYPPYGASAPQQPRPRRLSWGWGVLGIIALAGAVALLVLRPEIIGPSVSRFTAAELILVGALLLLVPIWRGVAIGFAVVGLVVASADIALAIYGSFGLSRCGYDGASAFKVWRSQSQCPASLGPPELEKWAIVAGFGVLLLLVALFALRSFRRSGRSAQR